MRLILTLAASAFLASSATAVDLATVTNSFGLRVYAQVAPTEACVDRLICPYSIESAMAALSLGATGETRTEIVHELVLPANADETVSVFKNLRAAVAKSASGAEWKDKIAVFVERGLPLRPETETALKLGFEAQIRPLAFAGDPAGATGSINRWISEATDSHLSSLVPTLEPDTRLVLVSAAYLKATWLEPFEAGATSPRVFHRPGSIDSMVPTMNQVNYFGYGRLPGCQALALPYEGGDLQLVILLPDERYGAGAVAHSLKAAEFTWLRTLSHHGRDVHLLLPKFRIASGAMELSSALNTLGVRRAFDPQRAELNGFLADDRQPLAVSRFLHQAYMEVDEQGTTAAAASAVVVETLGVRAEPKNPVEFQVDHPFLFLIQDSRSGVCLFLGSVANPVAP